MQHSQVSISDPVTFQWQVFATARGVMVLDGWGNVVGTYRTVAAAVLGMLATEAGLPPCRGMHNDNGAA